MTQKKEQNRAELEQNLTTKVIGLPKFAYVFVFPMTIAVIAGLFFNSTVAQTLLVSFISIFMSSFGNETFRHLHKNKKEKKID